MLANSLSIGRVGLVLVALGMFGRGLAFNLLAMGLLALAFFLDAVDGWVARKMGTASVIGGILDVAADRVTEMVCWFYFAAAGLVPFWIPVVIFIRGVATDTVRAAAAKLGLSMSGDNPMVQSRWGKKIIGAWWSRGGYAFLKVVTFIVLGLVIMADDLPAEVQFGGALTTVFQVSALVLVYLSFGFCILRAIPVLMDSRRYIVEQPAT
ncbi:CDP-alcohol phosphatidyltransferase family protein [Acidobacteriota bacterium]